jgi:hypothetical protein
MDQSEWRLTRGGTVLALLRPDGCARFATHPAAVEGTYKTAPAFYGLRFLFERELKLWHGSDELATDEWFKIWEWLKAPGLFLESPDGREQVEVFWIHFAEGRAWWLPFWRGGTPLRRDDPA